MSRRTRSTAGTSSAGAASRHKRHRTEVSYRETDSADDDDYGQGSDIESRPTKVARKSPRNNLKSDKAHNLQAKEQTRNSSIRKSRRHETKRSSVGAISKAMSASRLCSSVPWHTLEYDILFDIFTYAFLLLKNDKKSAAHTWLINTAKTCKAFQIPALSALYQSPPLNSIEAARGFLAATADKPDFYKAKVKHIQIEAIPTLTRKDKSQEPVSLEGILDRVPNIRSLAAELHEDDPSSKRSVVNFTSRNRVNVYRPAMIDVMTKNKTRLQTMRWNYFFNSDQTWPWSVLPEVHMSPCMQSIENLEILWLNVFTKQIHKSQHLEALVKAISILPNLKTLTLSLCSLFSTSDSDSRSFWTNLPQNLEGFTLIDCDDFTSETLERFLSSHGSNLRYLNLSHNRHLDLGFLKVLDTACPRLETFEVDISCYGLMLTSTDSEPSFTSLLPDGTIPTWPRSLRKIEMLYLRKWGRESATIMFQSLVDSNLTSLRHLVIKTTVDLDWRDRVAFRDEWTQRLHKVFKRQGLCNIVEVRIENLRPMETQYAERDFMDEEMSGDEDWTEDSHDSRGDGYAW